MSGRRSIVAQSVVSAGSTDSVTHEFDADATITAVDVHTYVGQEFSLLTEAYVITTEGSRINVLDVKSSVSSSRPNAVAGEDTDYNFEVGVEVEEGDELFVEFENTSNNYSYHADATVHYDEEWSTIRGALTAVTKVIS